MLQLSRHAALVLALLAAVAPLVDGVPGTMQADWQFADCELQFIMQFVTIDDWASLILPAAEAVAVIPPIASAASRSFIPVILPIPPPASSLQDMIMIEHDPEKIMLA